MLLVASMLLAVTGCGFGGGTRDPASIWGDAVDASAESVASRAQPVPPSSPQAQQPKRFPPAGPPQAPSPQAPSPQAPGYQQAGYQPQAGYQQAGYQQAGYQQGPGYPAGQQLPDPYPAQIVQPGEAYANRYTAGVDGARNVTAAARSQASALEEYGPARIVAQVGDQYILAGDVLGAVVQMLEPHREKMTDEQYQEQKELAIEMMVRRMLESKLMYVAFLQQIPRDKVEEAMAGVREQAFDQYNEKELAKAMKQAKVSTPAEFDAYLRRYGTSLYKQKMQYMERQLGRTALMQNIEVNPEITHQEMLDYYHDHLPDYDLEAKSKWEKLTARFDEYPGRAEARYAIGVMGDQVRLGGAPLSAVAKRSSSGLDKREGGYHDWTTRGGLRSRPLDQAIFALPPNLLSDIIEDETGFHIVRVIERRPAGRTSFVDAQVEIRKKILNQKRQEQVVAYSKKLKKDIAVWTVFDDKPRPTSQPQRQ